MAYFSNGTEGMAYENEVCSRCVHQKPDDGGCMVWMLHIIHVSDEQQQALLDVLIPRTTDGLGNQMCTMFHEKETA